MKVSRWRWRRRRPPTHMPVDKLHPAVPAANPRFPTEPMSKEECWAWMEKHMPYIGREHFEALWAEAEVLAMREVISDVNRMVY